MAPRVGGATLVVLVGPLTFHIPHFVIESGTTAVAGSGLVETVYTIDLACALVAAVGIAVNAVGVGCWA